MIKISLPASNTGIYATFREHLVGPFSPNEIISGEEISSRSAYDSLQQSKGVYHENTVDHREVTTELTFDGTASAVTPTPTSNRPYCISAKLKINNSMTTTTKEINCGIADGNVHYTITPDGSNEYRKYRYLEGAGTNVVTAYLYSIHTTGMITECLIVKHTCIRVDKGTLYFLVHKESHKIAYYADLVPPREISAMTLKSLIADSPVVSSNMSGTGDSWTTTAYVPQTVPIASPSMALLYINSLVGRALKDNPLLPIHFGDLAHEASKDTQSNTVNMIAFLRDLRRPLEMIPKLRNLKSLKGLSNNYLSVEYGLLPTIDDIKSIVRSLKSAKPYYDSHGFATYGASKTQEVTVGSTDYSLLQRIKLAVGKDDTLTKGIVNRVEDMGFLLDLETIWDLIPYSFVVDWLVDVGDLLARIDSTNRIDRLNIKYATMSLKHVSTIHVKSSSYFPYYGTIDVVHYQRWATVNCPVPPLSLQPSFQDFNHWLESAALIVQRKAK